MSVQVQQSLSDECIKQNFTLGLDKASEDGKTFVEECVTSPETSLASIGNEYDSDLDGFNDDVDNDHEFIKRYVSEIFEASSDLPYEDKARFGDLCKLVNGRAWFAKYIDSQRKYLQCVDETTFYKLVYTFALVLFECGVDDDYEPAKTLMNMAFTYYYIPDLRQAFFSDIGTSSSQDLNENIKPIKEEVTEKQSVWENANKWFKKEVRSAKQVFVDTPSFQELRQNMWRRKKASSTDKSTSSASIASEKCQANISPSSTTTSIFSRSNSTNSVGKIYLYEHLKGQDIWKSLRFWNQAFFLAVHAERKKRGSQKEWCKLSSDERENVNLAVSNITFGQLGTFVNNMKCLGLPNETCRQFLNKQSIIGNITSEQMDMLNEQIDDDVTF